MSLVELQKENTVIKRIIRSLPLDILKDNIIRIFKKYKKMYPDGRYIHDCLKHVKIFLFMISMIRSLTETRKIETKINLLNTTN